MAISGLGVVSEVGEVAAPVCMMTPLQKKPNNTACAFMTPEPLPKTTKASTALTCSTRASTTKTPLTSSTSASATKTPLMGCKKASSGQTSLKPVKLKLFQEFAKLDKKMPEKHVRSVFKKHPLSHREWCTAGGCEGGCIK